LTVRKEIGDKGEDNAVNFLFASGYEVLERNYRFGRAEIDIIASKESVLVFIEVKTRKNINYGYPENFLSEPQEDRIHRAAEEYVFQKSWQGEVRFDIIAILWDGSEPTLDHFEDAF
jgi:putative endonuclease